MKTMYTSTRYVMGLRQQVQDCQWRGTANSTSYSPVAGIGWCFYKTLLILASSSLPSRPCAFRIHPRRHLVAIESPSGARVERKVTASRSLNSRMPETRTDTMPRGTSWSVPISIDELPQVSLRWTKSWLCGVQTSFGDLWQRFEAHITNSDLQRAHSCNSSYQIHTFLEIVWFKSH